MSEQLSALIDSELNEFERAQVFKEMNRDRRLSELWSRYHTIGLAMRRETIVCTKDLADRVSTRLEGEQGPASATGQPQRRPLWRSPGALAAAASVAGVLLVGGLVVEYQGSTQNTAQDSATGAQIAATDQATRWEGTDPRVADELNALLVEHGEFTSASGMNGLTAYTKFVAYDSP